MHHLEHYQFCIIIRFCFGTELHLYVYPCICISNDPWFSAGRTNSTQVKEFFPVLVMSSFAVIFNMSWRGVSTKKSFCIYQSTTWLGRNRILVEIWTIIFLSKVKLSKSCLKRVTGLLCDWEWLQNFSTFLATFLDLKKAVPNLFFSFNPLNPPLTVISVKFLLVIAMLCKTES